GGARGRSRARSRPPSRTTSVPRTEPARRPSGTIGAVMSDAVKPRGRLRSISWRDVLTVGLPVALVIVAAFAFASKRTKPAPRSHIRMVSGSPGSSYRTLAERYKKIIETHGVKVEIVASEGALDNLERLADPKAKVDVGFVQGGLADGIDISR